MALGLGCDRGTPAATIRRAVEEALAARGLATRAVVAVASIDKKSDEEGLLEACRSYGWVPRWYPAAQLARVPVPNPSPTVEKYVGTPSVGEAAAILAAGGSMEDLLLEKHKVRGDDGKNATVSICAVRA